MSQVDLTGSPSRMRSPSLLIVNDQRESIVQKGGPDRYSGQASRVMRAQRGVRLRFSPDGPLKRRDDRFAGFPRRLIRPVRRRIYNAKPWR